MTPASNPLVSVIVPVYNVERYVDECLASIRAQTYANLEILVVEDCSTDGSLQALAPHLEDPRVRLIRHEKNGGLSAARNTGIEAATGEYVMFVDSDDLVVPALVDTCLAAAVKTGVDVVIYDYVDFKDGGTPPAIGDMEGASAPVILTGAEYFQLPQFAWLKFIRAGLLENSGLRFPIGLYYEDWPFHWELGFVARGICRVPFAGCRYRLRSDSITGSGGRKLLHALDSQRLVADVLERYDAAEMVRNVFAQKVHSGSWFVLTNIEPPLIPEAIRALRQNKATIEKALGKGGLSRLKKAFIMILLKLPDPVDAGLLRIAQVALNMLSPARRAQGLALVRQQYQSRKPGMQLPAAEARQDD